VRSYPDELAHVVEGVLGAEAASLLKLQCHSLKVLGVNCASGNEEIGGAAQTLTAAVVTRLSATPRAGNPRKIRGRRGRMARQGEGDRGTRTVATFSGVRVGSEWPRKTGNSRVHLLLTAVTFGRRGTRDRRDRVSRDVADGPGVGRGGGEGSLSACRISDYIRAAASKARAAARLGPDLVASILER
jgi:hypothetical protein